MTANVITYRGRSAAREVGKALGFEITTLERLSGLVRTWEWKDPKDTTEAQFRDAGLDLSHPRVRKFFELYRMAQDLPRHLGQHSGGMVICQGAARFRGAARTRQPCPAAWWCSGTRKTAPIWGSSRWTCSAWA